MPLPPAVPPPENVWNGDVDARPQIVGELPLGYEDPREALDSIGQNEVALYTFDPDTGALEKVDIDNIDDAFENIGGGLEGPLENSKKNDERSSEISAENRSKASKAEDSPPDGDDYPPTDDNFKDTIDSDDGEPLVKAEDDERIL